MKDSKITVEDVVGNDGEDSGANTKVETKQAPSKSADAEETNKVNTF